MGGKNGVSALGEGGDQYSAEQWQQYEYEQQQQQYQQQPAQQQPMPDTSQPWMQGNPIYSYGQTQIPMAGPPQQMFQMPQGQQQGQWGQQQPRQLNMMALAKNNAY